MGVRGRDPFEFLAGEVPATDRIWSPSTVWTRGTRLHRTVGRCTGRSRQRYVRRCSQVDRAGDQSLVRQIRHVMGRLDQVAVEPAEPQLTREGRTGAGAAQEQRGDPCQPPQGGPS